ncbi:GspE/PulE family protein [Patescibacteria group bacterium]|nr:GspE/PulE family protein [Patescibacteria group bacterium]
MTKQKTILDVLIKKKLIDPVALDSIKRESEESKKNIEEILLEKKIIDEKKLYQLKAELLKTTFRDLTGFKPKQEVLKLVPLEAAQHYGFVPFNVDKKNLEIGMLNPNDIDANEALKFIAHRNGLSPKVFLISQIDFKEIIKAYSTFKGEVKEVLEELKKEIDSEKKKPTILKSDKSEKISEEAPISKVVALIINNAIEQGASDIHIEPNEKSVRVRFRVDGVLKINLTLPINIHAAVVSRIKILSRLKIDETRKPQDGRFFTQIDKKKIDFRISTFPTYAGEKVVMRILDPSAGLRKLSDLGLDGRNLKLVEENIQKPNGLILVTGPTGSGKSTTLYSILNILNQEGVNIISLEDPIEYYIEGVSQSQVRPEIDYTFASGLRSILRQDPDKIMVGEIRDKETASLAVHAALTGHLVLSTLHTNDALGVVPRLIDMGIDPYLLPPTLLLIVAQRLVRKLCPIKKEFKASDEVIKMVEKEISGFSQQELEKYNIKKPYSLYEPIVSKECPRGTKGRIGIFEVIAMTPELEEIILTQPSDSKIKAEAARQGMTTMLQDGIIKALRGSVGFEEVKKAVEE